LKGQHRWLAWGLAAYLLILAVVTTSMIQLHRVSRQRLDEALGERLLGIAVTATYLANGDSVAVWAIDPQESLEFLWLASRLEQIRRQNELAEVSLCDPDERVLISAAGRLRRGEANIYWTLDRPAVQLAREGFPSVSKLYRIGQLYQKSAHAPIFTSEGQVAAVLTVEGSATFFAALAALRSGAWLTGILVVLFLTLMGWLLLRLQVAMSRYRASIQQQENLAVMGRMTAGIAHEIRNPLGIISGAAQQLAGQLQKAGLPDEMAGYITEEVQRLDRILKGYLAFGSDDAVEWEEVDLVRMVQRTRRLLAEDLAASGIEMLIETTTTALPIIEGDPRRLQQVLLNLLLNAKDAMPAGGQVTVSLQHTASQVVLRVADEGTGLNGQPTAKLFAPFWTTREKGSGLGLSVSRRIVLAHGGNLTLADRTDGPGAVAELRLPCKPDHSARRHA
jgi:signal transduction histidine kinase